MSEEKKKRAQVSGVFPSDRQTVEVGVSAILFTEEQTSIVYCPALNVYGYGDGEERAKESLGVSQAEFFRYALNKKTLVSELEALGWAIQRKKKFIPPTFSSPLDKNVAFRESFDTRNFAKFDTGITIPLAA